MSRGDAAVTAFSGARQLGEVPADLHPLDVTYIDLNGPVLQVFDLSQLGGAPSGQVANAPILFQVTAGEIGQVFGVALDGGIANDTPNIYATSTSLFGLQIVAAEGERLVKGEPGARWMAGQFGLEKGGTPGSVWRIDGKTGVVSLFANVTHDGKDNAGPGLGAITYDPKTEQFFVSDLETGLIHRLNLDGKDLGTFDHGTAGRPKDELEAVAYDPARRMSIESPDFNVEDPKSWGFAAEGRSVFAVAVQDGRLYYSAAEGPQIWSVGLKDDGSFADDARFEIDVSETASGNVITDIVFDGPDTMYLVQRGEIAGSYDYGVFAKPEDSSVLRYVWDEKEERWSEKPDEYAIGLKPPHRSTEGGIALNYGYDSDGNIDYGQCRATLWTTGEHLREGEDSDRVYQGGAPIIHGLQGNDKNSVRPENEPPYEAWYIDNDGLFLDSNVYGHVGDVAIFDPCDERTIDEAEQLPYPPEEPYYPPLPEPEGPFAEGEEPEDYGVPGLYIDKVCEPGIFGGEIRCKITIINIGETLSDAVDLWDAATILNGPGAGGAVVIDAVNPDGPDWLCSPVPTPNLWCGLPPDALEPGETRSIEVVIDTGPLFAAGNFGFRNCAELEAPWFDIACDDAGTKITVTKTAPDACNPAAGCTFTTTVKNESDLEFSGDVQLTDAMFFPDGTGINAPIVTIDPPDICAPAPAAVDFSCTANLTLAPGASQEIKIQVLMPAAPPAYWAQNCFAVSAPGVAPPALPLAPGDEHGMTSCAWVPVGGPAPLSNLRVEKTALNGGQCIKQPGDIIACDYEIAIINDGPSPFFFPISFSDEAPATAAMSAFPGPWVCLGGPPITCDSAVAIGIPVGDSFTMPVTVTTPLAPLEGAGCVMPNKFTLTAPVGTDQNFFAGDDSDTAEADAFLEWVLPDGTTLVTCDPTNLKTTKKADGPCTKLGDGYRCKFAVETTNLGPDPHNAPIKITEQLGFAPNAVTFSAPWGCSGGGTNFQCTHPKVELAKGESVKLDVTVDVPDGKHCSLTNTAIMTFPPAGTRFNGDASDDAASATAEIPSKDCVRPDRPQCKPGTNELRSGSGACVCETGYLRAEDGQCAGLTEPEPEPEAEPEPEPEPELCPDGNPVPKSGRCPEPREECEPGPNETRDAKGQCVCKRGFDRDNRGRCVEPTDPADECESKGWDWDEKQERCVQPPEPEDDCEDRGWVWNEKTETCVPPVYPEDECEDKGWTWNERTETCVPPVYPEDECEDRGWTWNYKLGICLPPIVIYPEDECERRGWVWNQRTKTCKRPFNPERECRHKGWIWNERTKTCKPPFNPEKECKQKGWVWVDNECFDPASLCKKKGWEWNHKRKTCSPPHDPAAECKEKGWEWNPRYNTCNPPPDPEKECKQKGWEWNNKRKTCNPPPDPAAECKKKGWDWNERAKVCNPPPDPEKECKQKGWDWNNKRKTCNPPRDPAAECKEKGWEWNNKRKTCNPPRDPAAECKKKGWAWNGKACNPPSDPAADCKKKGWDWNNKRKSCTPPRSSQPSDPAADCRKAGKFWDGKRCLGKRSGFTIPR